MKNIMITILVLTTLVSGYFAATSMRVSIAGREGETTTIERGDLTLPIKATGEIKPVRRVQIKSEASGEVIEIVKQPGERVRAGARLIRLQPDDEERNVRRAELGVVVAKAALEEARSFLEQARGADLDSAEARVQQIEATLRLAELRAGRVKEQPDLYHDEERAQRLSDYQSQLAQLENARASREIAILAIPRAQQGVKRAEAEYETRRNNLADARKRLAKTDIVSPIDGIVAMISTQVGEVIQGGKSTLTGGTVLAVVLDMEKLILQAEVDEADIGRVLDLAPEWAKPGHDETVRMPENLNQAAASVEHLPTITVETLPKEEFKAVMERIHPLPTSVQNVTTYLVDVVIISPSKEKLLPGMRGEVEFTSEHVENVVLCPNEAIRRNPNGKLGVYVPKKDAPPQERQVEFVVCKIGISDGAMTEIIDGLKEGMVVYTKLPAKQRTDKKASRRKG